MSPPTRTTSTSYLRDPLGRTLSSETDYGHFKKSHGYSYLSNGAVGEYRAPSGGVYSYKWNLFGLPQSITVPGDGIISYRYKADDPRKVEEILYPGGSSRTFTYRGDEVEEVTLKNPAGVLLERQKYRYGKLGELQGIETEEGTFSLTHDEGLRLTSFTTPEGIMEKYQYDELGRRSPKDGEQWRYNELGVVTKTHDTEYSYDANDNRTSEKRGDKLTEYHYDAFDRLLLRPSSDGELGR